MSTALPIAAARRIALAAQGFGPSAPWSQPGGDRLRSEVARLGIVQIDPINVLVRSQYLPMFSRLGPYQRGDLDGLAYQQRELFEFVGHEWSLLPVELHPLLRWRMHAFANDPRWPADLPPGFAEEVFAEVVERGPLMARDLSTARSQRGNRSSAARFEGRAGKKALTWLSQSGRLAVAGRNGAQAVYDVAERVIPPAVLAAPTPERDEARRELLMISARALGIGTAKDLASYFLIGLGVAGFSERTVYPDSAPVAHLVAALAAEGRLRQVQVAGWPKPAYLHPDISDSPMTPPDVRADALLSPFDSLIWDRDRVERLFSFRFRSEIYVPAPRREYGYYVLPYLLGDSLVARIDLRADRPAGALAVLGAFAEPGVPPRPVAEGLARQLRTMADWLGLSTITVDKRGDLSAELSRAMPPG